MKMKKNSEDKKNSELFQQDLIVCSEEEVEMMIKGYQEMADLNLQLATDNEGDLVEVSDYETWLCGV